MSLWTPFSTPTPDDVVQIDRVQQAIVRAILPFGQNTEAAVIMCALVRCVRVLLWKYPEPVQRQLLEGVIPFLRGQQVEVEGESPLIFPVSRH